MHNPRSDPIPRPGAFYLTEPPARRKNLPPLFWLRVDIRKGSRLIMPSTPIRIRPGEDGQLIVQLPYSPDDVAKIKTVVGRGWHARERHWTIPPNGSGVVRTSRRQNDDDLYTCLSSRAGWCPQSAGRDVRSITEERYADPYKSL